MARRVSPTERARAEIDELFASDRDLALILEEVARLSVRLLMQTALEAEVDAFLGRVRYQRRTQEHPAGVRNGWRGVGPIPWEHEPNRGFLRALYSLGRASSAIGEAEEPERIEKFLNDSDPSAKAAIEGNSQSIRRRPLTFPGEGPPSYAVQEFLSR